MRFNITPVASPDLEDLVHISVTTFEEAFGPDNEPQHIEAYMSKAFTAEKLRDELENKDSEFYFIKMDQGVVGYLKINRKVAQTEEIHSDWLEIERIYVLAAHHGQGLGQRLLDKAHSLAEALGIDTVWLGVWEFNHRAIRFYQKNGYTKFSEHIFRFGNDDQVDILMRRSIV